MPLYDYYSKETDEVKEIFHSMSEEPEVLDSQGNPMKRIVSGGTGFIMKGGTRNKDWGTRYGGKKKKSSYTMSPEESGSIKASMDFKERKEYETQKEDPYANFRDADFD